MPEKKGLELTRRKALAGLGAIGAASAGAGLGTSAFFSDQETFENNRLTAGELDLKVDWEEHYSFPQVYGLGDPTVDDQGNGLGVTRTEPEDTTGYTALPSPTDPLVWVPTEHLSAYMDNTAIEAYPDTNGDGVQDAFGRGEVGDFCTDGADLSADLDPTTGFRTNNADTYDTHNEEPKPLVALGDVKPGDFGELTLSLHLCDNPGYVWMNGNLVEAAENGITEPESESSDGGPADETTDSAGANDRIELLDAIRTCLWYDDGDNVFEPRVGEQEEIDLMIVFDQSESMNSGPNSGSNDSNSNKLTSAVTGAKSLVDTLGGSTHQGIAFFSSPDMTHVYRNLESSTDDIKQDLDDLNGPDDTSSPINDNNDLSNSEGTDSPQTDTNDDGKDDDNLVYQTDMKGGIQAAHEELTGSNARSGARKIMVLLSDGQPYLANGTQSNSDVEGAAESAKGDDVEIFTIAYGANADKSLLESVASSPSDRYAFAGGQADIESIFGTIGRVIGGEEKFFGGTLRELLQELASGAGIPLDGDGGDDFDETGDDPTADSRGCFGPTPRTTYIGLAWWLPTSVGNEVQTDSVAFDVGFYTEQCRHNDGSGMTPG